MALPKIAIPTFSINLPSNKKEVIFRPFMVREEKALLIAMESKDTDHMQRAMIDIIASCIVTEGIDINKLPSFDIEYLFLKIRAKSVGEKVTLSYRHVDGVNYKGESCDAVTNVEINLDDIEVAFNETHKTVIPLNDKLMIKMRYPTLSDIKTTFSDQKKDEIDLVVKCIECVYDDNEIYEPDSEEETKEFIGSLSNKQFTDIMNFFETMPKLQHTVTYKFVGCGQEDTITLKGLADFF
jgi:hypothetical protein